MRLKLISLNLWNGGKLWEPLLAFLKQENADILTLQEVQHTPDPTVTDFRFKTLDYLSPKLGLPNRISAPAFNRVDSETPIAVDTGTGILSRTTIIETDQWFFTKEKYQRVEQEGVADATKYPCNLQYTLIQINQKKLHVFNTHGIWGEDGNDTPERLAMSKFILEKIGDKKPAVLCGDFNTDATSQSMKSIAAKMHDVFGLDKRATSFNMKQKPANSTYSKAVVDFIFTTPDIKILSHSTPNVDISDHIPLVMEFEVP